LSNALVSIDSVHASTTEQYAGLADVPPEDEWLAWGYWDIDVNILYYSLLGMASL
jgi:hypothetical protein